VITIPAPGAGSITDFTVEAWFNAAPTFSGVGYLATLLGTTSGIGLSAGHPFASVVETGGTDTMTSALTVNDGAWHYLAVTRSGSTLTLYVDGAKDQQITASGPLAFSATQMGGIGSNGTGGGSSFFAGKIEDVAGYTSGLSSDRVLTHYQIGLESVLLLALSVTESPTGLNLSTLQCACGRSSAGQPVDTEYGNFWHAFTDLSTPGRGIPLSFGRTYSSSLASATSPFGPGWAFSYGMSLNTTSWTVTQEDASQVYFTKSGSTFTTNAPGSRRPCH
jgi:hypothetical protein